MAANHSREQRHHARAAFAADGHPLGGKVGDWDTGLLAKGESKEVTFKEAGTYFYICTPHPWMYGQVRRLGSQEALR
jgi:plastocyanin